MRLDYLLKTKRIPLSDVAFYVNGFLENMSHNEAILFLRRAIDVYPEDIELKKMFLKILLKFNLFEEALIIANHLILEKEDAKIYYLMGLIFEKTGDITRALKAYHKAHSLEIKQIAISKALLRIYKRLGRLDLAFKVLEQSLAAEPNNVDFLLLYGNEQFQLRNFTRAKQIYEKILQLDKNFIAAYVNLGVTCKEIKEYKTAERCYVKAIELDPKNSGAYNNLGVLYKVQKNFLKSVKALKKALVLNPKHVDAYANLGVILKETNKPQWSLKYFETALRLDPKHTNANVDYAIALLLLGNYKKGLAHYQYRIKMQEFLPKLADLDVKKFYKKGTSIEQKRVLVYAEQGFGDAIQFVRYLHFLKAKGAFVILRVRKELQKLFEKNQLADLIICEGEQVEYDYHMPLLSLLHYFDIDPLRYKIKFPYLTNIKKGDRSSKKTKNIAFAYSGSATHRGHLQRFIDPDKFSFLTTLANTQVYSIQKGDTTLLKSKEFFKDIIDKTDSLNDFFDTASLLLDMDLVITSDTSIVHLCGALGITTWVCLPISPDWRWGRLGEETFWYPSVRVFRQKSKGNWSGVFAEIELLLRKN
jgi:tetratricopeptide (TPR) repeat protein